MRIYVKDIVDWELRGGDVAIWDKDKNELKLNLDDIVADFLVTLDRDDYFEDSTVISTKEEA